MRCYYTTLNNEFVAMCPFYISYGVGNTKEEAITKMCHDIIDTARTIKPIGTYDPSIWGLYWIQWLLDISRLPSQRSTFEMSGVEIFLTHLSCPARSKHLNTLLTQK